MIADVDYHIHTYFSDGDMSPEALVDRYIEKGYSRIAITDHDSLEGSMHAVMYAAGKDIEVIPGIELSTRDEHGNTVHILGYHINYSCPELTSALSEMNYWRAVRNDKLLNTLVDMGYEVTIDDLLSVNEGRYIGKPTFAAVLVEKGVAEDADAVFKGLFRQEGIRALHKKVFDTKDAVGLIHQAGGIAVFAHPMEVRRSSETNDLFYPRIRELIDEMVGYGIDGVECYHPSASMREAEMLRDVARSNNLYVTKGSDFHSDSARRDYEG